MEFIFAYLAGLLTLINPCVLPVLPIVLVGALNANKAGPLALAAGMSVSFVVFGVLVTAFGAGIGLTQDRLAQIGAVLMMIFGLILIVPMFARRFEVATAGVADHTPSARGRTARVHLFSAKHGRILPRSFTTGR